MCSINTSIDWREGTHRKRELPYIALALYISAADHISRLLLSLLLTLVH